MVWFGIFFSIRVDQLVWTRGPTQLGCGRSKHLGGAPGATRRLGGQTLYVRTIQKWRGQRENGRSKGIFKTFHWFAVIKHG